MLKEHIPVAFTDAHAFVSKRHVSAAIVHWPIRARAKEVNKKLFLPHYAVLSTMRPKAPKLRIGSKSRQEIICYCCDSVISAKALIQCLRPVTHCVLLQSLWAKQPFRRVTRSPRRRARVGCCARCQRPRDSRADAEERDDSRRVMARPQVEDSTLPYRQSRAVLCITTNLARQRPLGVRLGSESQSASCPLSPGSGHACAPR